MSNEQFPLIQSAGVRAIRLARRFKKSIFLVAFAMLAAGGSYAVAEFFKWREREKESAQIAALMADLGRPNASESAPASDKREAGETTINRMVPDTTFTDLSGRPGSLREYRTNILVISMTSTDCPISRKLVPALSRLPDEFKDGRVRFLLVNTARDAKQGDLESHASLLQGWRYVHDPEARIARVLSASTTTETFVIDEAQTLQYRGAVDDRFEIGVSRHTTGSTYLRNAVAGVSDRQPLALQATEAPGCFLGLPPTDAPKVAVTWHNQISRFVQHNCTECHRPGAAGPFSLETYPQVTANSAMIEYVLEEGIMPPWFADPRHGTWRNVRAVSSTDREMFNSWVSAGYPEGDPADAPVTVKRVSGWSIREPDIVIDAATQEIPAEGYVPWRKFPVTFTATQDLWVAEAEIRPSEPQVVHHAMLYIEYPADDPRRQAQTRAESEDSGGGDGFWLSYFPGRNALILPPGRGKLIPRNSKVYLQMHYVPNGTATVDRPRIGFKLLAGPPEKAVVTSSVIKWDFRIPPNSTAVFTHSDVFDEDVRLLSLMPHMHYRGTGAQVFLMHPDGRSETLLNVPRFDPDWQLSYEFPEPLLVSKGTRIAIRHEYDNTAKNRQNPDPSIEIRHGNRTSDDMMINFFDWEPAGSETPATSQGKRRPFR